MKTTNKKVLEYTLILFMIGGVLGVYPLSITLAISLIMVIFYPLLIEHNKKDAVRALTTFVPPLSLSLATITVNDKFYKYFLLLNFILTILVVETGNKALRNDSEKNLNMAAMIIVATFIFNIIVISII